MSTMKEQMEAARAYIKAGQPEEARRILKKIDHPKAREWENRLPKPKRNYARVVLITIILVAVIALAFSYTRLKQSADATNQLGQDFFDNR